ncbi:g2361 [Coccomyxa elongata]
MTDHSGVYNALLHQKTKIENAQLALVRPHASCVLSVPCADAWAALRDWTEMTWLPALDGRDVIVTLVAGGMNAVGTVRKMAIGEQHFFEKLVALDDEKHILKWRLISHPDSANPFLASLVNYSCMAHLYPVTVGNETFIDWHGELLTEVEHAQGMKNTFERWYITAFQALQKHVISQKDSRQEQQQQQQPQVPTSPGMSPTGSGDWLRGLGSKSSVQQANAGNRTSSSSLHTVMSQESFAKMQVNQNQNQSVDHRRAGNSE